ncbi:ferredoxin-fold anticodon-binding domain protein [Trifolium repens]|nr:ferredoxin-fold anticodon-binding domain protein [Trifolium repens]
MENFQEQNDWWEKEEEQKWVTHYCSDHQILLVGDGDFSFSLSLAKGFGSASNIVASSFDTYDEVTKKYKNAKSNLEELQKLGACLLHGVDATAMKFYPDLKMRRFDRIIFNFPHAGFHWKEDNLLMIKMHMDLVFGFFKNASHMLRANGEIHVNHKTTPPFNNWNLEKLAEQSFMTMIECVDFNKEDYPGYNNKRGDSYRCDDPFPLGKCSTFKFINNPRSMKNHLRNHTEVSVQQMTNFPFQEIHNNFHPRTNFPFQEIPNMEQVPTPVGLNYHPQTRPSFQEIQNTEQFPASVDLNYQPRTRLREIQIMEQFPAPVDHNYHPQTRPSSFQEIQNMEQFPAPFDLNYHPRTRLPLREIPNLKQFPDPVDLNYRLQTSVFPKTNQLDYYPQTSHLLKMNEPIRSEFDFKNGYNPISRDYINSGTEIHGRVASSAECYHYERDMTHDTRRLVQPMKSLQSLQPWQTPTNCRYSLTDPNIRTMDITPPISIGARNEGGQYHPVEGSSKYLQEELYRNAPRPSHCFDVVQC